MPTPLWQESDRKAVQEYYRTLLMPLPLPRWYKQAMAERLAVAHLQAAAKEAERADAEKETQQS